MGRARGISKGFVASVHSTFSTVFSLRSQLSLCHRTEQMRSSYFVIRGSDRLAGARRDSDEAGVRQMGRVTYRDQDKE